MKKLLLGLSSGIIYTFISILIGVVTAPYLLKYLSKEEFGLYYLMNNIIVWTGLLNGGLRGSFKLQLATSLGKKENIKTLTSTIFITQAAISILIALIGLVISIIIPTIIKIKIDADVFNSTFIYLSISYAFSVMSNTFAAFLSVQNKDFIVYNLRGFMIVLQTILSIILVSVGLGIKGLATTTLLCEGIILLILFLLVKKTNNSIFQFSLFNKKLLKTTFTIGKLIWVGFLAQLLLKHTDLIIINHLLGSADLAAFIISSKSYVIASGFLMIIIKIINPQLTKLMSSDIFVNNSSTAATIYLKFITGFILLSGVAIYIFNPPFINWWVGRSLYLGNGLNLIMLLTFLFTSFNIVGRSLLAAKSKLKEQKFSALAEGVFHFILPILLGVKLGLYGIVLGILISSLLGSILLYFPLVKSYEKIWKEELDIRSLKHFTVIIIFFIIPLLVFFINSYFSIIFFIISTALFFLIFLKEAKWVLQAFLKNN